jgi:hypothetical protein
MRKFFTYTFSNREAFNRSKKEVEEDHGIDTIKGELCIIMDSRGLDVNAEPYEVLKARTSYHHIVFGNWQEFKTACKRITILHERPLCGEITVEVLPDTHAISFASQMIINRNLYKGSR